MSNQEQQADQDTVRDFHIPEGIGMNELLMQHEALVRYYQNQVGSSANAPDFPHDEFDGIMSTIGALLRSAGRTPYVNL